MAAKRGLYSLLLPGGTEQKAKGTGKGDTLNWHSINLWRWWLSLQFQTLSSGLVSRVISCQLILPQILLLHISLFYNIYFCSLLSSLKKIFCNVSKILLSISSFEFQFCLWPERASEHMLRHVYDLRMKANLWWFSICKRVHAYFRLNLLQG